jgi:hypothetical protein
VTRKARPSWILIDCREQVIQWIPLVAILKLAGNLLRCRIGGFHSGGCEEYCLPGYNAVHFVGSQATVRSSVSLPASGSKNTRMLSKKPA